MKKSDTNFIDSIVNIFRRFKILKPIINIYDKYKEGILYLIFGGLTTVLNIVSYTLLANLLNINYMVSNVIAWILSVIFAYVTNKIYVFESKTNTKSELIKEITSFFIARILSLLLDMAVMFIGISLLGINDVVIKILSNVFVIIANYFMSKIFIFKNKED